MDARIINTMWSMSLLLIGIATMILAIAHVASAELPDLLERVLGVIDFASRFGFLNGEKGEMQRIAL